MRWIVLSVALLTAACAAGEPASSSSSDSLETIAAAPPLDVPWINQKPELPRGCEVTSLAMLLRHAGVTNADKMKLAEEIDKVPFNLPNGKRGNPFDGFVGNMYTFSQPGYGAFHPPVERLAEKYIPSRVVKLTGQSFDDILAQHVGKGRPVWVITNAKYKKLDDAAFETWQTTSGPLEITWHEHSVVVTGYDGTSVYINDPLDAANGKNKKLGRRDFREAWEQLGRQALTYAPAAD